MLPAEECALGCGGVAHLYCRKLFSFLH